MGPFFSVKNVWASVGEKEILRGVNLDVRAGQIHFLMGPNGSGKTTLSRAIMGDPAVVVSQGRIDFCGEDLSNLNPEDRARRGIYLAFQHPAEVPGVGMVTMLRSVLAARGETLQPERDFRATLGIVADEYAVSAALIERNLNEGFSGGEKKRSELLQLAVLKPRLAILDEIDSGLDVDGLRMAAAALKSFLDQDRALLFITHSARLAGFPKPDAVHIMRDGRIVQVGDQELIGSIEASGFEQFCA